MLSTGSIATQGWRAMRQTGALVVGACVLAACTTGTKAPVVDMSGAKPATDAAAGGVATATSYVIRPGDTLYSIARAHNVTWQDIAMWNNVTDPSQLRVGQTLQVSAPGAATVPTAPGATVVAQAEPIGGSGVQQRPLDGASAPAVTTPTTPAVANTSGIDWLWPANGTIISKYGEAQNKGVDIEGAVGDPVVAAADGVVVYSGSGLRGYGNLLIVRHNASYLSAYAHNSQLIAKEGQNVRRGEKIAELGQTDAPSPRLHFEIRRGGTPEDPMQYLPQR